MEDRTYHIEWIMSNSSVTSRSHTVAVSQYSHVKKWVYVSDWDFNLVLENVGLSTRKSNKQERTETFRKCDAKLQAYMKIHK